VAANFSSTFNDLSTEFAKISGTTVYSTVGSTGGLYSQIVNGAPFNIFLAADEARVNALLASGLADSRNTLLYACGQLALARSRGESSFEAFRHELTCNTKKRLAIANPKTAPYGVAAQSVLRHLFGESFYSTQLHPTRIVSAKNASQAYQYVSSQQTEWGMVSLSAVTNNKSKTQLNYLIVPVEWYEPIRQTMTLLNRAKDNPQAAAFITFMQSEKARDIIEQSGYLSPNTACNR